MRLARVTISVPSLSRMFHSVRSAGSAPGVSRSGYRTSIGPSSAQLPSGHHPPHGTPLASAQSSAARSTPVWPPDTIFRSSPAMATV